MNGETKNSQVHSAYDGSMSGFAEFCDSTVLSDVTIRYGDEAERIFYGHKVVLASQSDWFKAAFTGKFAESHENKTLLKGDDPQALEAVLKYAYTGQLSLPTTDESTSLDNFNSCMAQYEVAHKYLFTNLQERLMSVFPRNLTAFINQTVQNKTTSSSTLFDTISQIYAFEATDSKGENPIVRCLLETLFSSGHSQSSIYYQVNINLWLDITQKIPEFGRDLFVRISSNIAPPNMQKRQCPSCNGTYSIKSSDLDTYAQQHCLTCGYRQRNRGSIIVG